MRPGRDWERATIDGARYVSAKSLSQEYGLDYQWDSIAKKLILAKDGEELKVMAQSSIALLNEQVRTMDKEAKFYHGDLFIPQTFARKTLSSFFKQEPIAKGTIAARIRDLPIKTVVIDAGHGGKDPGAIGRKGLKEKGVVLDIAKRLKRKLNNLGINVILTRARDEFLSLSRRSRVANVKKADFFISIHANASRSKWISGVEVFYLSEAVDDNKRAVRVAKNYNLDLKEKYSGPDTEQIIWHLLFRDDRKSSIELAEEVSRSLSRNLSQRNRGKKPARFYVLQTNVPAILIEVGFISNSREEQRLRTGSYRDKIAQGIANGIVQYNRKVRQGRTARY